MEKEKKDIKLFPSIIIFVIIAAAITVQMTVFHGNMGSMFLMLWVVLIPIGMFYGYKATELEDVAIKFTAKSLPAVFIMLSVGALISGWIASGTTPAVIYYGIKLINPRIFLVTAMLLCSIIALLSGTSYGSVGTAGIAMMGIGNSLGIPAPITAGACVCGAFFGDKMSPMSDTTILASSISEVNIFWHIKHMIFDQVPTYLISIVFFFILGFKYNGQIDSPEVELMMQDIQANFKIGFVAFIPLIITIVMLLKKLPALLSILAGAMSGILVAIFYQGLPVADAFNCFYGGYSLETENELLATIVNRGGITSMWSLVGITLFGFTVAGMLNHMKVLETIANAMMKHVKSPTALTATTVIFGIIGNAVALSQNFAIVMTGTLMAPAYKKFNLQPKNCSRDLEAGGTYGALLIPWNNNALFCAGALGVSATSFIPYLPLIYLTPIVVICYAAFRFKLVKIYDDEGFVDVSERLENDPEMQKAISGLQ